MGLLPLLALVGVHAVRALGHPVGLAALGGHAELLDIQASVAGGAGFHLVTGTLRNRVQGLAFCGTLQRRTDLAVELGP